MKDELAIWKDFLEEVYNCYEDNLGNYPCDNGHVCDRCLTEAAANKFQDYKFNHQSPEREVYCPECKRTGHFPLAWTYDRYGIPYKKVCLSCYEPTQDRISEWEFSPSDAGEHLEEEDY